jgi:hypothetical protein
MESELDRIRNQSRYGYTRRSQISIVDRLLKAKWCEESDLLQAYKILKDSEESKSIVFFQVPFVIRLQEKWISMKK